MFSNNAHCLLRQAAERNFSSDPSDLETCLGKGLLQFIVFRCCGGKGHRYVKKIISRGCTLFFMCFGTKPLRTVMSDLKIPCKMYKKLEEMYPTKNSSTRVQLHTRLHHISFTVFTPMGTYIEGMEIIFIQRESMVSSVRYLLQVAMLLEPFGDVGPTPYG